MDRAFRTAALDKGTSIAYTDDTQPDGQQKGFREAIGMISSPGTVMVADIAELLDYLTYPPIKEPVHVFGHDIGGMIAYSFASRYAERTASVVRDECPLPGTTAHKDAWKKQGMHFHFWFHSVRDLPDALVAG
ncbi:hypothetical protein FZEAL_3369 [Fusarium zealandicum]|uniref:Alpha/beta hydrolase n=1 Tax=Fusarium zealandicum TaxID=1053134 RepID=A0A8H4UNY3_9HYPO|nr:hypothetical protein FZEAL_3369 [Fusarium zealandicum]